MKKRELLLEKSRAKWTRVSAHSLRASTRIPRRRTSQYSTQASSKEEELRFWTMDHGFIYCRRRPYYLERTSGHRNSNAPETGASA